MDYVGLEVFEVFGRGMSVMYREPLREVIVPF